MDVNPERRAARQAALDAVEAAFPVREDSSFSELQAMNRELEAANRDMESLLMETAPSFVQPVSDAPTPGDRTPPDMENPRIGLGATIVILPTGDGGDTRAASSSCGSSSRRGGPWRWSVVT